MDIVFSVLRRWGLGSPVGTQAREVKGLGDGDSTTCTQWQGQAQTHEG